MTKLNAIVHLLDESGGRHRFGPGDELPDWAAEKITNPKAWAGGVLPSVSTEPAGAGWTDPAGKVWPIPATAETPASIPARSGTGSGLAEWAAYAQANNVDPSGTRTEVIARLDAAGIPTRSEA